MSPDQSADGANQQKAQLQALFDETLLDNGYIMQLTFDLFHDTLALLVQVPISDEDVRNHRIVFSGIRALFYQTGLLFPPQAEAAEFDPAVGLALSWVGYNYYDRPVVIRVVDAPRGLEKVSGVTMNFALDIMLSNGVLLLAASSVSIDDVHFDVGIPPKSEP